MAYTPIQPDRSAQTGSPYKAAIEGSIGAMMRLAGMFAPHEQDTPDMTVRLEAGGDFINGARVEKAGQNTGPITAPTTHPRIDLVVVDSLTLVASVITGVEAAIPAIPAVPVGKRQVCQIALATSTTAITNNLITDERVGMGGGGSGEAFLVNGVYHNLGTDPATELGYGTWLNLGYVDSIRIPLYPPAQSDAYVKATSTLGARHPYNATDPTKLLTGSDINDGWLTDAGHIRFHVDFGAAYVIRGIYYENNHASGGETSFGMQSFFLQGSLTAGAFAELTYAIDTNWVDLLTNPVVFDQHVPLDMADPRYVLVANSVAYRYAALKIWDNYGAIYTGLRRLVFLTSPIAWLRTA
jgi:hypothetical protein